MNDDFMSFIDNIGCDIKSVITIDKTISDIELSDDLYQSLNILTSSDLFKNKSVLEEGIIISKDTLKVDISTWK